MSLYDLVGNLAQDLRTQGWSQEQLERVCGEEAENYNVEPAELVRKVEAAYVKMIRDGFKEE